jgi:hypothetical protein
MSKYFFRLLISTYIFFNPLLSFGKLRRYYWIYYSDNVKFIGIVILLVTGLPLYCAGIQSGIFSITLIASLSRHTTDKDYYYDLSFELKFGGLRDFDSASKQDYTWLRNPKNLIVAFNTVKSIGLDKFVSKEKYNEKNNAWCCHTEWENKSLNEIIKGFVDSDTASSTNEYYLKFWNRRRKEGNLLTTYKILKEIDKFYNVDGTTVKKGEPIDTVLKSLLDFDIKIENSDSISYPKIALDYFNYLKSVGLNYSAYKLIFHNSRLDYKKPFKDSLLTTIKHDTLSEMDWGKMNDNDNGWIRWNNYPDPNRYYGP